MVYFHCRISHCVLGLNLCKPKQECISEGVPLIGLIYAYVLALAVECLWLCCWHFSLCLLQVFGCLIVFIRLQYWACSVRVYVCMINSKGFLFSLKQSVLLGWRTLKINLLIKRKPSEVLTFFESNFITHRCLTIHIFTFSIPLFALFLFSN